MTILIYNINKGLLFHMLQSALQISFKTGVAHTHPGKPNAPTHPAWRYYLLVKNSAVEYFENIYWWTFVPH
jgi:hypothetical protein